MRTLYTFILALFGLVVHAQQVWTTHLAYNEARQCLIVGDKLYAVMGGNLMCYDTTDETVQFLEKTDGILSDKSIATMSYSAQTGILVLVYANGNIDFLDTADGTVTNMPQYAQVTDEDIQVRALKVCGTEALLATPYGVIRIDLEQQVIKGYYHIGSVVDAALFDGRLYAVLDDGTVRYQSLQSNLFDTKSWQVDDTFLNPRFYVTDQALYVTTAEEPSRGLYVARVGQQHQFESISDRYYSRGTLSDGGITFSSADYIAFYTPASIDRPASAATYHNGWKDICADAQGRLWTAEGTDGVRCYRLDKAGSITPTDQVLGGIDSPWGPPYDDFFEMYFAGNRLLVATGTLDVAAPNTYYPYAPLIYEDGKWLTLDTPSTEDGWAGRNVQNVTSFVQDPADPDHHYVSTTRTGIYEYRNNKVVAQYCHDNSPFKSLDPIDHLEYVRTDGLVYDPQHNLWAFSNSQQSPNIFVLEDGTDTWTPVPVPAVASATKLDKTMFDTDGRLWLIQSWWGNGVQPGLLCLDYHGTLGDTRDDESRYRSSWTNIDGTTYTDLVPSCMVQDRSGTIWVGTDRGLFLITDPSQYLKSDFLITQVKVPRNDGTNYADYLLADVAITAIALDGADRKWIGTASSGVYLVTADGLQTIAHYDTTNSPLLSDKIRAIAVHPRTGEVFIGTELGLITYAGDASEPAPSLRRDNIRVYPNPVRPDYRGNVRIEGLVDDAEVRILSSSGQLVSLGRSHGGTFVWDVCNAAGLRVATGIYHIAVSTPDAGTAVVAKVAVVD